MGFVVEVSLHTSSYVWMRHIQVSTHKNIWNNFNTLQQVFYKKECTNVSFSQSDTLNEDVEQTEGGSEYIVDVR